MEITFKFAEDTQPDLDPDVIRLHKVGEYKNHPIFSIACQTAAPVKKVSKKEDSVQNTNELRTNKFDV
ncbi:MAG: hypothetical protein RSC43_01120 [Clostridia bacterium]